MASRIQVDLDSNRLLDCLRMNHTYKEVVDSEAEEILVVDVEAVKATKVFSMKTIKSIVVL